MLASALLLALCLWALGRVLRGGLVGLQARWITAGRPLAPFALTLRPVPSPAGEELWYAAGASLWDARAATRSEGQMRLGRWHALAMDGWRPRHRIGGRGHRGSGLVVVTSRRVLFRGTGRARTLREDVALGDVAHLRLEGPILVVERRSRPAEPLPLSVSAAAPLAQLIQAAAGAAARPAGPAGATHAGNARAPAGY